MVEDSSGSEGDDASSNSSKRTRTSRVTGLRYAVLSNGRVGQNQETHERPEINTDDIPNETEKITTAASYSEGTNLSDHEDAQPTHHAHNIEPESKKSKKRKSRLVIQIYYAKK